MPNLAEKRTGVNSALQRGLTLLYDKGQGTVSDLELIRNANVGLSRVGGQELDLALRRILRETLKQMAQIGK